MQDSNQHRLCDQLYRKSAVIRGLSGYIVNYRLLSKTVVSPYIAATTEKSHSANRVDVTCPVAAQSQQVFFACRARAALGDHATTSDSANNEVHVTARRMKQIGQVGRIGANRVDTTRDGYDECAITRS